jgi:spermidine synthase
VKSRQSGFKIYFALVGLALGFAITVFTSVWSRLLPPFSPDRLLVGVWPACSLLVCLVLGGLYFSSRLTRIPPNLNLLSLAMVGVGISGIVAQQLFPGIRYVVGRLGGAGAASPALSTVVGGGLAFAVLLVPCFLMSGVLAIAARLSAGRVGDTGPVGDSGRAGGAGGLGWLLKWVFLGAAAAAALTVFVLAPRLGYWRTSLVAAVIMAALGFAGLPLRDRLEDDNPEHKEATVSGGSRRRRWPPAVAGWVVIFGSVACAILWSRLLKSVIGDSVYAGATVFSIFMLGLALGAALGQKVTGVGGREGAAIRSASGLAAGAAGVVWMVLLSLVGVLPVAYLRVFGTGTPAWGNLLVATAAVALPVMFVPASLLGIWAAIELRSIGHRDAWDHTWRGVTLAEAASAALAAFAVTRAVPRGDATFQATLSALPWLCTAAGICLTVLSSRSRQYRVATGLVLVAAGLVAGLTRPPWNNKQATWGVHTRPGEFAAMEDLQSILAGTDLTFYEETPGVTLAVTRSPDGMALRTDGRIVESTLYGGGAARLAGHIPMLLHPGPRTVLIVGLSDGVTAGAVAAYPVEHIVCVEPCEATVRAAGLYAHHNGDVLMDSRLTASIVDPRHYMLAGTSFDVIILQPFQGALAEAHDLLTADFFAAVGRRLATGGIVCLRLILADMSAAGFRSAATAFCSHFPQVNAWWGGTGEILLIGSMEAPGPSIASISKRIASRKVAENLVRTGITDATAILSHYGMEREALLGLAGNVPANSADGCFIAFEDPREAPGRDPTEMLGILDVVSQNPADLLTDGADGTPERVMLHDQLDRCFKARSLYVDALAAARSGRLAETVRMLEEARTMCPVNGTLSMQASHYYILLSRTLAAGGRMGQAIQAARRALELNPVSYQGFYNLAALEQFRQPATAIALLGRATEINPYYVPALILRAQVELSSGKVDDAAETVVEILSIEPLNTDAQYLRALTLVERDRLEEARNLLEAILKEEPDNMSAVEALAYIALLENELDRASQLYLRVLERDPDNLPALNNYATVLAEKGEYREAIQAWTRALGLDPGNSDIIDSIEEASQKLRP